MRLGFLVVLTSCATLLGRGPDVVPLNTLPSGAYVFVNGEPMGRTPTQVTLDRDQPARIQLYLPGFAPLLVVRTKELNGWFWGSILMFSAVFPLVIDVATGNWQCYSDDPITIVLSEDHGPPPSWYHAPAPR